MTKQRRFSSYRKSFASAIWLMATIFCVTGCGKLTSREPEGSVVFQKYWAGEVAYLEKIKRMPEGVQVLADGTMLKDFADARRVLITMRDDQISRVDQLGYTAWTAASREKENRQIFQEQGTDWTRYADPQFGFSTVTQSERWLSRMRRLLCLDYTFRSVHGRIPRKGRMSQDGPPWIVGIIPQGTRHYRGILVEADGRQYPVVWTRGWAGSEPKDGNWVRYDPLNAGTHIFGLRKLPGALNWTVVSYSGQPADSASREELTAPACAKILRTRP